MEARNTYEWAQDKIDTVIGPEHREQRARERRLRQMQKKREKDAKRAAERAAAEIGRQRC